jgi:1,4-dihydroxy-6-naphthoate synthase
MRLRVGISPCPNDTFAFHAILERRIDLQGLEIEVTFADVQALNDGLVGGHFDLSKASFHQALLLTDRFGVLRAGSALGFGVGPLLVSADPGLGPSPHARVLCPGPTTTATLLYHCLHPRQGVIRHSVFSDIGAELRCGNADIGVLIHEGRLTYERDGLILLEDLGTSFEQVADAPVPLGGILASLALPAEVVVRFNSVLQDSISYAWENREDTLPTIRSHAQEMGEDVIWPYVELYVNANTFDLGAEGERSLKTLERTGIDAGVLAADRPPLQILG